ncbi:MAG: hypothetical protein EZS28_016744 [Streblomastix strix]|uniref:Uncharacterized protein n=1 Tax=Streblomastix strix TaxID=222440 RepID=A0A5J4VYL9_9EUKA|nr:MAG: hypothetical protein EZS28_016744 [Streblomastix strix]
MPSLEQTTKIRTSQSRKSCNYRKDELYLLTITLTKLMPYLIQKQKPEEADFYDREILPDQSDDTDDELSSDQFADNHDQGIKRVRPNSEEYI